MSRFVVNRCICHSKSFLEIKTYAKELGISTVSELQEKDFCSNSCRLCEPYVIMMLKTGKTEFEPGAYLIGERR